MESTDLPHYPSFPCRVRPLSPIDLPVAARAQMRRVAGEAIVACTDAAINPIQLLALLDMAERAAQALQEEGRGA